MPILRYHNGVDQVIVVSRFCRTQERNVISLPSGSSLPGEECWESAWRVTESITGLDSDAYSRGLLSTPLSSTGRGRLETVDIDARRAMESMGAKHVVFSPPIGQDIYGIPLQSLRETLMKFGKEGRAVDHRLSYLAEGMELRYKRDHQTLYAVRTMPDPIDGTGRAFGLLWMGASCAWAISIICGGLGMGTGLKVEVTRPGQMPTNWTDPDPSI